MCDKPCEETPEADPFLTLFPLALSFDPLPAASLPRPCVRRPVTEPPDPVRLCVRRLVTEPPDPVRLCVRDGVFCRLFMSLSTAGERLPPGVIGGSTASVRSPPRSRSVGWGFLLGGLFWGKICCPDDWWGVIGSVDFPLGGRREGGDGEV